MTKSARANKRSQAANQTARKEASISPSEQIRLARLSGLLPQDVDDDQVILSGSSSLRPSEIRERRPPGTIKTPLVQLDDDDEDEDEDDGDDDERENLSPRGPQPVESDTSSEYGLADEIFDSVTYIIPFSSLYLLLDILVHRQYAQDPSWDDYAARLIQALPVIGLLTFYANRYASHWAMNSALMTTSIISGCRLIWLVNKANFLTTIQQAPPVGTLWVMTIVQLPLDRAMICLATVIGWVYYAKMKLYP